MSQRDNEREEFIRASGWGEADVDPLQQDASFRRYFRLQRSVKGAGQDVSKCLLMDAPVPNENIKAYLDITALLRGYGLRVPQIYAEDRDAGFALIEDFGDATFTRLLAKGASEQRLYELAADALVHLHAAQHVPQNLPVYDDEKLLAEVSLFIDWFVPAVRGANISDEEREQFFEVWATALSPISSRRETIVLRDYHVDNLMIINDVFDRNHCGILDYQDAQIGARAYDLVSLIEDERRTISPNIRKLMVDRYLESMRGKGCEVDPDQLRIDMALLGAQRHAKCAGIFVRLAERDGKSHYLNHLPRVLENLRGSLAAPELETVRAEIEKLVPNYWTVRL